MQILLQKKEEIRKFYLRNPQIYHFSVVNQLNQIKSQISDFPEIGRTTFWKFLKNHLKLTYVKPTYRSPKADSENNKQVRIIFVKLLFLFLFNEFRVIYTDSTCVSSDTSKQHVWSMKQSKYIYKKIKSSFRYHFTVSISMEGCLLVKRSKKGLRVAKSLEYYSKLIQILKETDDGRPIIVILDNASWLQSTKLHKLFSEAEITLFYTPSNSPNLNTAEFFFEIVKRKLRLKPGITRYLN